MPVTRVGVFNTYIAHYRLELYRALQSVKGLTVAVCAPEDWRGMSAPARDADLGFPYRKTRLWQVRLPRSSHRVVFQPSAVWDLLRGAFDVFVMPYGMLRVCVWVNLVLGRILGRRVCLWGQGRSRPSTRPRRFLQTVMMRLASAVILYTQDVRDTWIARGWPAEKLFVAPNAVATGAQAAAVARTAPAELDRFRRERGLEGKRVALFVGRLQRRKRPDLLVRAMAQLRDTVPDAHAVIIGGGELRGELEAVIRKLDLAERVTMPGPIYDEDVLARYFQTSSVGVMPEAAGLFIPHAFTYGLPVVIVRDAPSHGPEASLVRHGKTGLRSREGGVKALACAIEKLLTDEAEQERMSANCRRVVEQTHNAEEMARGFLAAVAFCARAH